MTKMTLLSKFLQFIMTLGNTSGDILMNTFGKIVGNPGLSFLDMLQTGVLTSYSSTGLDDQNDTAK